MLLQFQSAAKCDCMQMKTVKFMSEEKSEINQEQELKVYADHMMGGIK